MYFEPQALNQDLINLELYNASNKDVHNVESSRSGKNVLRWPHYQIQHRQGKIVRVTVREVFDVALPIRKKSPMFGIWVGVTLSAENKRRICTPEGFAQGFLILSDVTKFSYKTIDYWCLEFERSSIWNDPDLAIAWPTESESKLAKKEMGGSLFYFAEIFS